MDVSEEGNIIVAKFVKGEIVENLKNLAEKESIGSAIVLSGIRMLKNVEIGYFTGKEYKKERIGEPVELVSLQGNIGRGEEDIICHFHVAVAGEDHEVRGGHLLRGEVTVVNEIVMYKLHNLKIKREKNPIGLMEMVLEREYKN